MMIAPWVLTLCLVIITAGVCNSVSMSETLGAQGNPKTSPVQQPKPKPQEGSVPVVPGPTQIAPGMLQRPPSQPIQLSQELKTAQAVARIEQTLATMAATLGILIGKVDSIKEQNRQLSEQIRLQTAQYRELPPNQRWELVFGEQAVLDRETGLIWERTVSTDKTIWKKGACANKLIGGQGGRVGRGGWHLPTLQELLSLAPLTQEAPFINLKLFDLRESGEGYWASTVVPGDSYHFTDGLDYPAVYHVRFGLSSFNLRADYTMGGQGSDKQHPSWCVRGSWGGNP